MKPPADYRQLKAAIKALVEPAGHWRLFAYYPGFSFYRVVPGDATQTMARNVHISKDTAEYLVYLARPDIAEGLLDTL